MIEQIKNLIKETSKKVKALVNEELTKACEEYLKFKKKTKCNCNCKVDDEINKK